MASRRDSFDLVSTPPTIPLSTNSPPLALHPKRRSIQHCDLEMWARGRHLFRLFCVLLSVMMLAFGCTSVWTRMQGVGRWGGDSLFGLPEHSAWLYAVCALQAAIFGRLVYVFSIWPYDALVRELGDLHCGTWMIC
ncbi:hypothetical protein SVAN01_05017 [Stagonosporopsis vannaccii]|nr:hypothetical protein SVAN01_05017 [Stagonosporopsis vannaccii]